MLVQFIINALAVWRLSSLLVNEDGPYYIFKKLREQQGFSYYADGDRLASPDNHVLACVWCCSIWVALFIWLLPDWLRNVLALSAVACVLEDSKGYGNR